MTARRSKAVHSETKTPAAHNHPRHKVHALWPPWLAGPLVVGLGELAHHVWGRSLPSAGVVPLVLVLSTVVLSALTHRYAAPRTDFQQWHAVLSVVLLGLSAVLVEMFGAGLADRTLTVLGQSVLGLSAVLALSWNIRRFEVVRGSGQDSHPGTTAEEDWHGLKKPKSLKIAESDGKRTTAKVKLAEGQVAADVEKALRNMGSSMGTITGGQRVVPGAREGEVEVTMLWEDALTEAVGWSGPDHVGGSIADPISLGVNEQGKRVILRLAGNYDAGIAPGHLKIVGMPRSGKGICVVVIWGNLRGRRDVWPVLSDHAKGEQMLGMLRPGMPKGKAWINTTEAGAKQQAAAVMRAIAARNKALGEGGFSSWTPKAFSEGFMWKSQRIYMPALVFHIEEFAPIGIASPNIFTTIAEQGLSAGIFLIVSTQRASHDRFPTSMRSVIGNGLCFGAHDDMDVSFALPDGVVDGGASPAEWQTRHPGRFMGSLNGQDDGMSRIPAKVHFASTMAEFEAYMKAIMAYLLPMAPDLDPCTTEAFGAPYAEHLAGELAPSAPANPEPTKSEPATTAAPTDTLAPYGDEDEEEDDDMRDEDDDDPNAAEYVRRPLPADLDVSGIDPHQPLPEWEGGEVDLSLPPSAGWWTGATTPEGKRELLREILQRLVDAGKTETRTGELVDLWRDALGNPKGNQAPTVGRYINEAAAEDVATDEPRTDLFGCLERIDGGRRGRFRILIRPRVAALNGHHA